MSFPEQYLFHILLCFTEPPFPLISVILKQWLTIFIKPRPQLKQGWMGSCFLIYFQRGESVYKLSMCLESEWLWRVIISKVPDSFPLVVGTYDYDYDLNDRRKLCCFFLHNCLIQISFFQCFVIFFAIQHTIFWVLINIISISGCFWFPSL